MSDEELDEIERTAYRTIRMIQERHQSELKPYFDRLYDLRALRRTSFVVNGERFINIEPTSATAADER